MGGRANDEQVDALGDCGWGVCNRMVLNACSARFEATSNPLADGVCVAEPRFGDDECTHTNTFLESFGTNRTNNGTACIVWVWHE